MSFSSVFIYIFFFHYFLSFVFYSCFYSLLFSFSPSSVFVFYIPFLCCVLVAFSHPLILHLNVHNVFFLSIFFSPPVIALVPFISFSLYVISQDFHIFSPFYFRGVLFILILFSLLLFLFFLLLLLLTSLRQSFPRHHLLPHLSLLVFPST